MSGGSDSQAVTGASKRISAQPADALQAEIAAMQMEIEELEAQLEAIGDDEDYNEGDADTGAGSMMGSLSSSFQPLELPRAKSAPITPRKLADASPRAEARSRSAPRPAIDRMLGTPRAAPGSAPRSINLLDTRNAAAIQRCTQRLAAQLKERNKPFLKDIVTALGVDEAFKVLERTLEIEADGGQTTVDGQRKRTSGGIFFQLAKERIGHAAFARATQMRKRRQRQRFATPVKLALAIR